MKVLIPATHYYPVIGGIETWTKNIAERLSQKAKIFVVTGKVKNWPKNDMLNGVKITRTSLFTLTNLSSSPLFYTLSLVPFIFFKSSYLIKKEKINFIHCQGFLSSLIGFCLSKLTGIPYITTVQRLERKGNFLKEMVYRNSALCIGVSNAIKKYFEQIECRNIEVVPNGIDLNNFELRTSKFEAKKKLGLNDEFVIISVARLEKVKGIEYLIESISNLKSPGLASDSPKGCIPNPICLIIGDGSERKNLERLVEKLNLEERVKFFGEIPNEKIPEYLAAADCFVLPSLKEGFGIAILEAMAAGVPVIGTKVGGILDIITDGETGILVESGNPEATAQAILRIYSNPNLAQELVQNAKNNLEKYSWQNIAKKVYETYLSCGSLSTRRRGASNLRGQIS